MMRHYSTKRLLPFLVTVVALLVGIVNPAFAVDSAPKITLTAKIEKEAKVLKDGKIVIVKTAVDKPKRGDLLAYSVAYKNDGSAVAKSAEIVNPVPANTVYQVESATGKDTDISFSIDGGNSYQKPPVMYLATVGGKQEKKVAPPEMYTHIKWIVAKPLAPGATGDVNFVVKVK
jgi:uncharacterized repeat protein (TIGR01451 family)